MIPFFGLLRFTVHEEDNHTGQNGKRFLLAWWAVYKDSERKRIMQLTLQAEEPRFGLGSAITKERKQNEHDPTTNQALQHMGAVVLPWEALYEFGRMICLGFVVTFGRKPSAGKARGHQPHLNEHVGRHSIQSGNTWSSRHTAPVFTEPVPQEGN